jgi:membrane-bound ClpP family serine protease
MTPLSWSLLLLALGLIFLVLEFLIPSGGALAVMCALSFLAAIVVGFVAGPTPGTIVLLTVCIIVPTATAAAVRWWPDTPIGKLILVQRPRTSDEVLPQTVAYRGLKELIGHRGRAKSLMLPGGSVVIDGKTYDAVSEGMTIEPRQSIIVVSVSTQRLVVRPDNTIQAELAGEGPGSKALSSETSAAAAPASNEPLIADIPDPFAE